MNEWITFIIIFDPQGRKKWNPNLIYGLRSRKPLTNVKLGKRKCQNMSKVSKKGWNEKLSLVWFIPTCFRTRGWRFLSPRGCCSLEASKSKVLIWITKSSQFYDKRENLGTPNEMRVLKTCINFSSWHKNVPQAMIQSSHFWRKTYLLETITS